MSKERLKIHIGKIHQDLALLAFLRPNFDPGKVVLNSFSEPDAFSFVREPFFEIVSEPALADFFLIPYNFFHIKDRHEIINYFDDLARSYEKKILIFALGDSSEFVSVSNSIVFRTSQYRSVIKTNEIIIPAFVPDMLRGKPLVTLTKKEKATVGFCGWAEFKTKGQRAKFFIKNMFLKFGPRRQGIYFRSKAMTSLNSSNLVNTDFLIRSNHFGNRKTIIGDPLLVRKEYVNNILNSDFILSPKGDGNYSVRFYETLSLGRVPLLIDTDTPLPLEEDIKYQDFILKVDYRNIDQLSKIVSDFYDGLTNERFAFMQKKAREVYEKALCPEVFLRQVFSIGFLSRYK
jgi:hypothetical protein